MSAEFFGCLFFQLFRQIVRNQTVQLNKDSAMKILCGIHVAGLLVHELQKGAFLAQLRTGTPKMDAIACIRVEKSLFTDLSEPKIDHGG